MRDDALKKDGRGYYTYVIELPPAWTPEGKRLRRRKVIRGKDRAAVRRKAVKAENELLERGDLTTDSLRTGQWFDMWLTRVEGEVRPTTYNGYKSVVKNHIVPGLGPTTLLDKITGDTIRRVYAKMAAAGKSSTYLLNAHRVMSTSFEDAVREGRLYRNPVKLVKAPRAAVLTLDVLSTEESIQLLEHVSTLDDGARWATGLLTGARRGEVIGLELERVGSVLDLSWQLWLAAFLSTLGIILLNRRGGVASSRARTGMTVISSASAACCYALFDVLVQKWSPAWGIGAFLPVMMGMVGLFSLPVSFLFPVPLSRLPGVARKWLFCGGLLFALQSLLLVSSIGHFGQATTSNVIYSSRGLLSVVAVSMIGHWFHNAEQKLEPKVLRARFIGAGFMFAAIVLVLV